MKNLLTILLGVIGQIVLLAQTPPPNPGDGDNDLHGGGGLPIDQYTVVLVVVLLGVALWYYKKSITQLVK